jgi:hypothetical protein
MACNPSKIILALHEEKENVRDIVYEKINQSDRTVLKKIPDGGIVERSSNQDSIIYGEGTQASMAYRSLDHEVRDLEAGEMNGRKLTGRNGIFDTNIQDIDDNACHGFCTIDFAQGYRERTSHDFGIDLDTPVKCARELDRLQPSHIKGYFEGFRRTFTKFGFDNFSDNLLNNVIEFGEANSSVIAANQFSVSQGGWQAKPEKRISIHFLEDYRDHIMAEMEGLAMDVSENWMLEVELPKDDWFEAVMQDQLQRYSMVAGGGPQTNYQSEILKDPKHELNGRAFHDYGNIRCFFNSRPIRGYFKDTSPTTTSFVRVLPLKNEVGEQGGLVPVPNHAYRQDRIQVEGIWYDMCTLVPHIHKDSFKRYGLGKPLKTMGEANLGVNYNVEVADGAYLPNNKQNDKFQLIGRHDYRLKVMYPELSGFIAYRHSQDPGYSIDVTPRNYVDGAVAAASPEDFRNCDLIDPVTQENCAECDEVPEPDGSCVDAGAAVEGTVRLDPASAAFTTYDGSPSTVTIAILRDDAVGKACSVDYTVKELAVPDALDGVQFTAIGATTVSWAAGDDTPRYVEIAIIGGSGDVDTDMDFEIILDSPVTCSLAAGGDQTTITIEDVS